MANVSSKKGKVVVNQSVGNGQERQGENTEQEIEMN